ncbi:unnamed protein product [Cylicocyclus nassatus]|uniref:Uncharacterized protein n=1 Tax=Cylicocyclus nassatus TaxID=53992 RepID=A0AA36MA36_CYLNA|nr:unnamed protein product [Cylicocyclus nassatus]
MPPLTMISSSMKMVKSAHTLLTCFFGNDSDPPSQGKSFSRSSPAPLDDCSPSPTETASFMKSERTPLAPVDAGRKCFGKRKYPYTSKSEKASAIEAVHKATDAVREQLQEMKHNAPIDEYYHFGNYVSQTLRSLPKALVHEQMALIAQVFAYDDITFITTKPDHPARWNWSAL